MKKLLARLGVSDKASFKKTISEFIRFSFVGVTSVVVQYGGYLLLLFIGNKFTNLSRATVINAANIISFFLAVINSYVWNTIFVFKPNKDEAGVKSGGAENPRIRAQKELEKKAATEDTKNKFSYGKSFIRMIITNLGYLLLSTLLLNFFIYVLNIYEQIAPILYMIILNML